MADLLSKERGGGRVFEYNPNDNYNLPNEFTGCSQMQFLAIFLLSC